MSISIDVSTLQELYIQMLLIVYRYLAGLLVAYSDFPHYLRGFLVEFRMACTSSAVFNYIVLLVIRYLNVFRNFYL